MPQQDSSVCKHLKPHDGSNLSFRATFQELQAASRSGCHTCSLLREGVSYCVPENLRCGDGYIMWSNLGWFFVPLGDPEAYTDIICLEFFELSGKPSPFTGMKVASFISGNTASAQSFVLFQNWLQMCTENHKECGPGVDAPLPRRVLDLSQQDVRLYETQNEPSRYICLSHCWGTGGQVVSTTGETLSLYKQHIPWANFSKSFQDAINFCRRLHVYYLWIDSLCIIQDDDQDWREQAEKMAEIYMNSYLTIAATKSSSGVGGCYSTAASIYHAHHIQEYNLYVRQMLPHVGNHELPFDKSSDFPLLQRGWVYQERHLSRRVLHFAANELIWECREGTACECSQVDVIPSADVGKSGARISPMSQTMVKRLGKSDSPENRWFGIVQEYSSLGLTKERDKFPALSGIVKQMQQERPGDRYLAGLWAKTLLKDMLWRCSHRIAARPQQWRAPSWSWASVKTTVGYTIGDPFTSVQVLDVRCITVGPDPRGELTSAQLTLSARVFPATLCYSFEAGDHPVSQDYALEISRRPVKEFRADYSLSEPGDNYVHNGAVVYGMCLARLNHNDVPHIECIVLRRLEVQTHKYERVGWMWHEEEEIKDIIQASTASVLTII